MSSISGRSKIAGFLLILAWLTSAFGAFELDSPGPRSAGLGGAGVALSGDGWGGLRNPALVCGRGMKLATDWSQQFGLPELNQEVFALQNRFGFAGVGIQGSTFGSELYRETSFELTVARPVREALIAGVSMGIRSLSIDEYSSGSAPVMTAGLLASPTKSVKLGAVWKNLNRAKIDGYRDRLPESLTVGASARLGTSSIVLLDLVSEPHFPVESRFGIESRFSKSLTLRVGGRAEPFRPSGGIEVSLRGMRFHYAGDLHPQLGSSHSVGFEIQLDR